MFDPNKDWRDRSLAYEDLIWSRDETGDYTNEGIAVHPELPGFKFYLQGSIHGVCLTHFRATFQDLELVHVQAFPTGLKEAFEKWWGNNTGNLRRMQSLFGSVFACRNLLNQGKNMYSDKQLAAALGAKK